MGGISNRAKEIKRRRHRRKKLDVLARRLKKATASEKTVIVEKLRNMSSGGDVLIANWGLAER